MNLDTIYHGDATEVLARFPDNSIDCCVTSPPYFGMRDYGCEGQIGLEPTPQSYIARLVEVFDEVWRVLKPTGTFWLNIGDTYAPNRKIADTIKAKDLMGIPWALAFALRNTGWYLRQDIIWAKNNPTPESVKDRCTKSHEHVFLLTKSSVYHFDSDAIKEPADPKYERKYKYRFNTGAKEQAGGGRPTKACNSAGFKTYTGFRNKRDVWFINKKGIHEAHFAIFPEELVSPCVNAGSPPGGIVLDPFMGSGTTAIVAKKLGRMFIGCELNPEYIAIANSRIAKALPL